MTKYILIFFSTLLLIVNFLAQKQPNNNEIKKQIQVTQSALENSNWDVFFKNSHLKYKTDSLKEFLIKKNSYLKHYNLNFKTKIDSIYKVQETTVMNNKEYFVVTYSFTDSLIANDIQKNRIDEYIKKLNLQKKKDKKNYYNSYFYKSNNNELIYRKGLKQVLFVKNINTHNWRLLPYNIKKITSITYFEPIEMVYRIENLDGYSCDTTINDIKYLGEFVFNQIINENFSMIHCNVGMTKKLIKETNKYKLSEEDVFNGILYRKITILEDSRFIGRKLIKANKRNKTIDFIKSYNIVNPNKKKRLSYVIVEYKIDSKTYFFEIECILTDYGWKIADDINYGFSDLEKRLEQINKRIKEQN